jgi:hypothetical protein
MVHMLPITDILVILLAAVNKAKNNRQQKPPLSFHLIVNGDGYIFQCKLVSERFTLLYTYM